MCSETRILRDATTQLINQRDGWLIRHVGAKVHVCDPGQGDCTRLQLKFPSLSPPLSLSHTHTSTPTSCANPPCKVDPYYPPSQTCSALSTSSGQLQTKKPEMRGVSATWPGPANPLILALSFLLSPSFLCPQRKKRKNCNFFIACMLAFPSLLSSLLLSLSFFNAFVHAPTWA